MAKNKDKDNLPPVYSNPAVKDHDEVFLHEGEENPDVFVLDEGTHGVVIPGPRGPMGIRGDDGVPGAHGDTGLRGPKGNAGLQGEKGETGLQGDQGDQGEIGEAPEWEYCTLDFDKEAGIRFKRSDGVWDKCIRIKGRDGIDGADGHGGGGGGGGTPVTIPDALKHFVEFVPPLTTKKVGVLPIATLSAKYFITMTGVTSGYRMAFESLMVNLSSQIDFNVSGEIGAYIDYDIDFVISTSGTSIELNFINNTNETLQIDTMRFALIT